MSYASRRLPGRTGITSLCPNSITNSAAIRQEIPAPHRGPPATSKSLVSKPAQAPTVRACPCDPVATHPPKILFHAGVAYLKATTACPAKGKGGPTGMTGIGFLTTPSSLPPLPIHRLILKPLFSHPGYPGWGNEIDSLPVCAHRLPVDHLLRADVNPGAERHQRRHVGSVHVVSYTTKHAFVQIHVAPRSWDLGSPACVALGRISCYHCHHHRRVQPYLHETGARKEVLST